MKKVILGILSANFAIALPNGAYIGAGIGGSLNSTYRDDGRQSTSTPNIKTVIKKYAYVQGNDYSVDPNASARAGIIWFFGVHNGARLNASFDYALFKLKQGLDGHGKLRPLLQAGVGADYLLAFDNKPSSWGLSVGGGIDFNFGKLINDFKSDKKLKVSSTIPYAQVGIFKGFDDGAHIIDFGVKKPFGQYASYDGKDAVKIADLTIKSGFNAKTTAVFYFRYSYNFAFPVTEY